MALAPNHLQDLEKSGLNFDTIAKAGIESVVPGAINRKLGFNLPSLVSCYEIPYPGCDGFSRFRAFYADGKTGPKYLQRKDSGNHLYVPASCLQALNDLQTDLLITEGEKKCLKASQEGLACVAIGGLWNWTNSDGELLQDFDTLQLANRQVLIVPDNDWRSPKAHGYGKRKGNLELAVKRLGRGLIERGADVKIVLLPPGALKGLDDYLCQHTVEEFRALPVIEVPPETRTSSTTEKPWPSPMDRRAFHGLAGEFADMLMPHTEADEAAVLAQFLVAFGNVIGRNPHYRVEADIHCANEFIVLVGPTAKGRKGTSWGPVREIVRSIDDEYVACRIKTGLSSGEGVIYQVREPAERDLGALDKRLLVYEPEFAGTLKVLAREGNTLSPVIRQAWDTGHLATLTKNNPLLAKDAHISIVTHITHDELKRRMSESEIFNGFANRFLWVCARRSKLLPEGGNFWQIDKADFVERLMAAVKFARFAGELRRDERASRAWVSAYEVLTRDEPGLLGAVLSRAEAHVLRLQVLYALLDQSEVVREEHLLAALAFWDYCDRSARYIFGDRTGDIIADRIYEALVASGDKGMSRNEIVDLFDRHVTKDRINVALDVLMAAGRAERTEDRQTGGRPVQRYHAKH